MKNSCTFNFDALTRIMVAIMHTYLWNDDKTDRQNGQPNVDPEYPAEKYKIRSDHGTEMTCRRKERGSLRENGKSSFYKWNICFTKVLFNEDTQSFIYGRFSKLLCIRKKAIGSSIVQINV